MNSIHGISMAGPLPTRPANTIGPIGPAPAVQGQPAFKEFLLEAIDQVNTMQVDADKAVQTLQMGGDVSAAEVLTAVQKADLALDTMRQVRDRLVQAYQEIKEIQI